jgi:hypothetical protein
MKKKRLLQVAFLAFAIGLAVIIGQGAYFSEVRYHFPWVILFACSLGCVIATNPVTTELTKVKVGRMGEVRLQAHLQRFLPGDDYTCYFNVPTLQGDIDCTAVGASGVFVIEAKNHHGIVAYVDGQWENIKISRRGNTYRGQRLNPSRQVMAGVVALKDYLAEHGINVWIQPVVVLTHPDAHLYRQGTNGVKVLRVSDLDSLFPSARKLDQATVERITTALDLLKG